MYARVTYVQAPEGKFEEGLNLWYENVLPVTKSREGFRGVLSLTNPKDGNAIALTLWDMQESMMASTEAEYHKQAIARFGEFFENAHEPENYELDHFEGPIFEGKLEQSAAEREGS
jgi:hypothetical protein